MTGNVLIGVDGSGDIAVREVGGDFEISRAGRGRVRHRGVAGAVLLGGSRSSDWD